MTGFRSNSFKVQGLDAVLKKLARIPNDVEKKVKRRAFKKSLGEIEQVAKQLVPVGTGGNRQDSKRLKDGFKIRTRTKKGFLIGELINNRPHAHLKELGFFHTGHKPLKKVGKYVPPKPFLRPATDQKAERAIEIFAEEVEKMLKTYEAKGKI